MIRTDRDNGICSPRLLAAPRVPFAAIDWTSYGPNSETVWRKARPDAWDRQRSLGELLRWCETGGHKGFSCWPVRVVKADGAT